jgi:hypothetical protein
MPTLPNMGLVTPTQGGDSGAWDDKINAAFALVDAHDHTSGKGVRIPVAGLDIDEDLVMGGLGLTGVGRVDFTPIAALATGANVLFTSTTDGELYWRTTGGANVQLTDGAGLNITLVGGIVGDYSTVGAEVAYSDADQLYSFKDESSPGKWARITCGPVRIFQFDTTETVYVEQIVAAALDVSYTVTWPAALPGAAALVQINAAGELSFSNSTTQSITAAGYRYTVAVPTIIPASAWAATGTHTLDTGGYWVWGATASDSIMIPVPVVVGETITGFTIYMSKNSDATNTVTASLIKRSSADGSATVVATDTEAGAAIGATTMAPAGFTELVASATSHYYQIEITASDATPSAADRFYMAVVTRT